MSWDHSPRFTCNYPRISSFLSLLFFEKFSFLIPAKNKYIYSPGSPKSFCQLESNHYCSLVNRHQLNHSMHVLTHADLQITKLFCILKTNPLSNLAFYVSWHPAQTCSFRKNPKELRSSIFGFRLYVEELWAYLSQKTRSSSGCFINEQMPFIWGNGR